MPDLLEAGLLTVGEKLMWPRPKMGQTYYATCRADLGEPRGDVRAYCDAVESAAFLPGEPKEDIREEIAKWNMETKLPAFDKVAAVAPNEVREDIDVQLDDLRRGDDSPSAKANAARQRTMAFDHENWGWQTVDATVTEYEFDGVPRRLDAGNDQPQAHEQG